MRISSRVLDTCMYLIIIVLYLCFLMSKLCICSISHRLSKADQRKLAAHITQVVPITEEEALPIIDSALDTLYESWQNNVDPGDIPPPPHTTLAKAFSLSR